MKNFVIRYKDWYLVHYDFACDKYTWTRDKNCALVFPDSMFVNFCLCLHPINGVMPAAHYLN